MIEHSTVFVGGAWVPSAATESIPVLNPATEEVIASVPRGTAEDVDRAVRAAAAAFPGWAATSTAERAAILRRLARIVDERTDEMTRLIVSEVGQPISLATESQTRGAVAELEIMAEALDEIDWSEKAGNATVRRVPSGVVGAITAWNAPMRSIISKACAAITAGCTAVVKPSEVAPLNAYLFTEWIHEAGLPAGVFNLVSGTGPEVGEAIVTHPDVNLVSLTGSVRAGRRVMELAAQGMKRVHLELGGKSANIVLEDADFARAISVGLDDAYRNSGQVCGGLTRLLVPRSRLAEAEEIAVAYAESFVIGDPMDPATTLGPVTTAEGLARVRGYIQGAIDDGVRMLTGGPETPEGITRGYFVKPTLFSADNTVRIAREEIFGPVVVIIPFQDEADAIAIANDSDYGLAGAVWAADPERARRVAHQIRTGRVRINGAPLDKHATHGGFKFSGMGREWGRYGVEEFLEYQSIMG